MKERVVWNPLRQEWQSVEFLCHLWINHLLQETNRKRISETVSTVHYLPAYLLEGVAQETL